MNIILSNTFNKVRCYNFKFFMSKKNKENSSKTIEEYRRDIFALKMKLKSESEYLQEIKEKYADLDIFSDKSYNFPLKIRILQYTLNDIRQKLHKFSIDDAYEYYQLNYSAFALVKSCECIGISKQMIFRAVDVQGKKEVKWFDFVNFLKDTMRLDMEFITPLMKAICPDEAKPVLLKRYTTFLQSFMIQTQQNGQAINDLEDSISRIITQMNLQKVEAKSIWKQKELNIALLIYGLMSRIKNLDVLDCVACYCKCDPLKIGVINASAAVNLLEHRVNDSINFDKSIRLQK